KECVDEEADLLGVERLSTDRLDDLHLVALRQPTDLPSRCRGEEPELEVLPYGLGELLEQSETAADPALVATQKLGDLLLGKPVLAHERVDDPRLFDFAHCPARLIEEKERRFRRSI